MAFATACQFSFTDRPPRTKTFLEHVSKTLSHRGENAPLHERYLVSMKVTKRVLWGVFSIAVGGPLSALAEQVVEPAGPLTCTMTTGFHDGDTFKCVRPEGTLRVRVAGIDAPETSQGFWRVSRDLLRMRAGPGTTVDCYKVDRYKRQVCRVTALDGNDVALELVRTGLAWHTRKYADEQTPDEREIYAAAEVHARARHLGLWSQPEPQDPSDCRAAKKVRQKCR